MKAIPMLDHAVVAVEKDQEVNLLVKLTAPEGKTDGRRPLNIGLVIDRSGSMAGEKLECAKTAMKRLITHLGADDLLSIVTFESGVEALLPPSRVVNKDELKQRVDQIEPAGGTNLSGGWLKGLELVSGAADGVRLNRIMILTDGQANEGITVPAKLRTLGSSAYAQGRIVTTTLGFGEGFDEDLLTGIARESGGRFYFIETADAAPAVFQEELAGLLSLVAQNIEVKVTIAEPVRLIRQWSGYPGKQKGRSVTFALGDAYAKEEKSVLLTLLVPGVAELGERQIAEIQLGYTEITEENAVSRRLKIPVRVNVADEAAATSAPVELEVLQELALQVAAEARQKAITLADSGDLAGARRTLRETCERLEAMPTPPSVREEILAMEEESHELVESDYGAGTRKRMSSAAYNLSTSQHAKLARERVRRRKPDADGPA